MREVGLLACSQHDVTVQGTDEFGNRRVGMLAAERVVPGSRSRK